MSKPKAVFLYSQNSSYIKNTISIFKDDAIQKGYDTKLVAFDAFKKAKLPQRKLAVIIIDQTPEGELDALIQFLDKQPPTSLESLKFALFAFGSSKDLDKIQKLRQKLIELGAVEFFRHQSPPGEKSMIKSLSEELWAAGSQKTTPFRTRASSWGNHNDPGHQVKWVDYPKLIEKFKNGVAISDYSWGDEMSKCFTGCDAVDWICENAKDGEKITRSQAVGLGQMMLQEGLFSHITNESPFRDKPIMYRFNSEAEEVKKRTSWLPPEDW